MLTVLKPYNIHLFVILFLKLSDSSQGISLFDQKTERWSHYCIDEGEGGQVTVLMTSVGSAQVSGECCGLYLLKDTGIMDSKVLPGNSIIALVEIRGAHQGVRVLSDFPYIYFSSGTGIN